MRIAVLATIHKPVSQDSTGGTEAFAYNLVEELVRIGQDVTLFATSDSKTSARLVSLCSSEETNEVAAQQSMFLPFQLLLARKAVEMQGQFDIFHNNFFETFLFTAFLPFIAKPVVHTNHHDFFHSERWKNFFKRSSVGQKDHYVFVSHNQKASVKDLPNSTVIHNGIDEIAFTFNEKPTDYFLWLGRIAKKKGVKDAVLAARESGNKLIIAGVIDKQMHQEFFDNEIKPLLTDNTRTIIRPISFQEKLALYQNARALLVPIHWEEPFALTMVEAMACGTPVIAYARAATPEIVEDGRTGFLVREGEIDGLVAGMSKIDAIRRQDCRKLVVDKFTRSKMAFRYKRLYRQLVNAYE